MEVLRIALVNCWEQVASAAIAVWVLLGVTGVGVGGGGNGADVLGPAASVGMAVATGKINIIKAQTEFRSARLFCIIDARFGKSELCAASALSAIGSVTVAENLVLLSTRIAP
jgi:hypothetical protein